MAEYQEESGIEYLFSLLQIGDFTNFFERLKDFFENRTQECLSDDERKGLITLFLNNNVGENQRKNQQILIRTLFAGIPQIEDRLSFHLNMVKAIEKFQPNLKDHFLLDVFSIEQSREIARFVYSQSNPYGEAHYHAIFYFITGVIIQIPDIPVPPPELKSRLKSPHIQFSDQQVIQYIIPSQQLLEDARDKEISLIIRTGTREPYQVSLEKHREEKRILTGVYTGTLAPCEEIYRFSLYVNGSNLRTWEIQGLSAARPFLAFRDPSGDLIKDDTLPRERTWIITQYPILQEDGILQKGLLGGEWLSYYYYLINPLPHCDYYLQISGDSIVRLPFVIARRTPSLIGARLDEVIFDPPIPWYSQVPRLLIPYTVESENNAVKIEILQKKDAQSMTIIHEIDLQDIHEYIQKDQNNRTFCIDLSHQDILGSSPVGEYSIRISNSATTLHFCNAPNLGVLFHPPVLCVSHKGYSSIEVEIEGPTSIYPLIPCNKIREGLFEIPIAEDPELLQKKRIQYNIAYDIKERDLPDFLKLNLELPLIKYSIQGLSKPQEPVTEDGTDLILREDVVNSLETAKILIEKPKELFGTWKLCIGAQESGKCEIDNSGNLVFPLVPFRETLLADYDQQLPFVLKYVSKGKTTDINLFSLLDWTLEYKDVSIGFDNDQYNISVTWRERGRTKRAFITMFFKENGQRATDIQFDMISVSPSKYRWRENTALLTVPMSMPEGTYSIGFIYNENDEEGWAPGPSVKFPYSVVLTRDPYKIAEWHFSRNNYAECISWLEKIPQDDTHYPDALLLKAKCMAYNAEHIPNHEQKKEALQQAVELTDEAISLKGTNSRFSIAQAHLHNRIGFYDEGNTEHYRTANRILIPVLGQASHELPAIIEYGISLMGMRKPHEAMKIFQFLRYLDPKDDQPDVLWGEAMLLYQYALQSKGSLGQRDQKKILLILEKARKIDGTNPLIQSLIEEVQRFGEQKSQVSQLMNSVER